MGCERRKQKKEIPSERIVVVDVNDKDFEYMKGHVVDGKIWQCDSVSPFRIQFLPEFLPKCLRTNFRFSF